MKDTNVWLLAAALCFAGGGLALYKNQILGLPLSPAQQAELWVLEARVAFTAENKPAKVELRLPASSPGFDLLNEDFISRGFGLATDRREGGRTAQWSIRNARGKQALYYRATLRRNKDVISHKGALPGYPPRPEYTELMAPAVDSLLAEVRSESADIASFAQRLIIRLNTPGPDPTVHLLRGEAGGEQAWVRQLVYILAGARIPARVVYGLRMSDGLRNGKLEPWLEVHNEQRWLPFDPHSGEPGFPPEFLVWQTDSLPLATVTGGKSQLVEFAVRKAQADLMQVASSSARAQGSGVLALTPAVLPLHIQNVYAVLLTIPLGAFIVVLLRNIIGFQTFGTFMPVLIALAFRETQLLWGLILFSSLVALGLGMRFALEKMKLLLVPRLASVLILVILLMLMVSLASHHLGLERGLSVALFPMVILAMTIERMSIVWEENGARTALVQGVGSMAVAAFSYLVMTMDILEHLVLVFPETLLILLAATLLLGRYTGYRLTELWRFRTVLNYPD